MSIIADPNAYYNGKRLAFQELDKLMLPDVVVRDNCPVKMSSKDLYDVVRYHIKNNIDMSVASITSDYNFCFTVKKKIRRSEPLTEKIEIKKQNGYSYKNPRYKHKTHVFAGDYTIFEMTYSPKRYEGYTPIPSIVAKDLEELDNKIRVLLDDLMEKINKPSCLCPHCEGTGVTSSEKIDTASFFN